MDDKTTDIWFGPGAEKGVFGAGVAHGLHLSIAKKQLDASRIRLYGSSIGCLTAAFLSTGNTACGLKIFREETDKIITASNLVPAMGARIVNRIVRARLHVPSVLNLQHVFHVMARMTPQIADQLRRSPMPVFAETVDRHGKFRHAELGCADEPLREIRSALNYFPFSGRPESDLMDSVIKGYGFIELVRSGQRPLVVVLNAKPTTRSAAKLSDLACAALCADVRIARLYLRRRGNQVSACRHASGAGCSVLLISPPRVVKLKKPSDYETSHTLGIQAARRIVTFINAIQTTVDFPRVSISLPRCD